MEKRKEPVQMENKVLQTGEFVGERIDRFLSCKLEKHFLKLYCHCHIRLFCQHHFLYRHNYPFTEPPTMPEIKYFLKIIAVTAGGINDTGSDAANRNTRGSAGKYRKVQFV